MIPHFYQNPCDRCVSRPLWRQSEQWLATYRDVGSAQSLVLALGQQHLVEGGTLVLVAPVPVHNQLDILHHAPGEVLERLRQLTPVQRLVRPKQPATHSNQRSSSSCFSLDIFISVLSTDSKGRMSTLKRDICNMVFSDKTRALTSRYCCLYSHDDI